MLFNIVKSTVQKSQKVKMIPNNKETSPTLFIIKAFIADLFASILVYQKFINK